ncbi:MAG TPA: helix-hairpin-helix domain-containing protein [Myxococcota bacterium]|nr:helix-hairpin-helix domain-containing protein [Myxococcota bacterium]HRY93938.1 helix-hairpin-helix domain-containing protein [Myxococcota bacterium]HSA23254.1 helix-hairpin-helix domain-containing protein [Myxococcota bacterium]
MGTRQELGIFVLIALLALPGLLGLWAGGQAGEGPYAAPDCRRALLVQGQVERAGLWCPGVRKLGLLGLRRASGLPEACALQLAPGRPTALELRVGQDGACSFTSAPLPGSASLLAGVGIELNTATAEDLEAIPGIGPTLAGRIVQHREEHGPFASLEELEEVRGIGSKTLWKIKPFLR